MVPGPLPARADPGATRSRRWSARPSTARRRTLSDAVRGQRHGSPRPRSSASLANTRSLYQMGDSKPGPRPKELEKCCRHQDRAPARLRASTTSVGELRTTGARRRLRYSARHQPVPAGCLRGPDRRPVGRVERAERRYRAVAVRRARGVAQQPHLEAEYAHSHPLQPSLRLRRRPSVQRRAVVVEGAGRRRAGRHVRRKRSRCGSGAGGGSSTRTRRSVSTFIWSARRSTNGTYSAER
jgi:hypothetical protein